MARFHISTYILIVQTVIIGLIALFIFLFGIPPSIKKWLQEEALEYMGENKASYMMKKGVDMLPEADQDEIKGIRKGAKDAMGTLQRIRLARLVATLLTISRRDSDKWAHVNRRRIVDKQES